MNVAQETLGFRRQGLSPCLSLLMSAFALPISPACLSTHLHRLTERSSTTPSDSSTSLHLTALSKDDSVRFTRAVTRDRANRLNLWKRFATRDCARFARASSQNEVKRT